MQCADCRAEHDRVKLGASLAGHLEQADARISVWKSIENSLDGRRSPQIMLIPESSFGWRNLAGYAVGLLAAAGLVSVAYFMLFRADTNQAKKDNGTVPQHIDKQTLPPSEIAAAPTVAPANTELANTNTVTANTNASPTPSIQTPTLASLASFQFETISGSPKVGAASTANSLAVSDYRESVSALLTRTSLPNIGPFGGGRRSPVWQPVRRRAGAGTRA